MDERTKDILRRSGYAMGYVEKREVPLKLLKDLVERTISDLSAKEGISPPKVRWTAEIRNQKPDIAVSYIPEEMGGPLLKLSAWHELPLRQNYKRFEPFIRNLVAHEFKHYLQDVSPYEVRKPEEELELQADEYAARYSGMTPFKFLYAVRDTRKMVEEKAKAGVRVVV